MLTKTTRVCKDDLALLLSRRGSHGADQEECMKSMHEISACSLQRERTSGESGRRRDKESDIQGRINLKFASPQTTTSRPRCCDETSSKPAREPKALERFNSCGRGLNPAEQRKGMRVGTNSPSRGGHIRWKLRMVLQMFHHSSGGWKVWCSVVVEGQEERTYG
jgi:hypothetical protein